MNLITDDGKVYSGIKTRETEDQIVLRDAEDRELVVAKATIDEQAQGGSLMPVGLIDTLTRAELVDLVRFISELGKIGPYAVGKERLVRRWRVLADSPTAAKAFSGSDMNLPLLEGNPALWRSAYSVVEGFLPLSEVPTIAATSKPGMVQFDLEVTAGGPVHLRLTSNAVNRAWIDGQSVEVKQDLISNLSPGRHRILLSVQPVPTGEMLRVELLDIPGSSAQAQIVGGK